MQYAARKNSENTGNIKSFKGLGLFIFRIKTKSVSILINIQLSHYIIP